MALCCSLRLRSALHLQSRRGFAKCCVNRCPFPSPLHLALRFTKTIPTPAANALCVAWRWFHVRAPYVGGSFVLSVAKSREHKLKKHIAHRGSVTVFPQIWERTLVLVFFVCSSQNIWDSSEVRLLYWLPIPGTTVWKRCRGLMNSNARLYIQVIFNLVCKYRVIQLVVRITRTEELFLDGVVKQASSSPCRMKWQPQLL